MADDVAWGFGEEVENEWSEEMISLNKQEEDLFIDLWQQAPCLWNPNDKNYKNKCARRGSLKRIAAAMNHPEWSDGQVLRKMKSLRGSFNNVKRKRTTSSSGGREKKWCHYERLRSFLDTIDYKNSDSQSNLSQKSPGEDSNTEDVVTSEQKCGVRSATPTRPALYQVVTTPGYETSTYEQTCIAATLNTPLVQQKCSNSMPERCFSQSPSPLRPEQLTSAMLKMTGAIEEKNSMSKQQDPSPNAGYGQYVVERLDKIKSAKALLIVQNKIDNLIHETLINEMSDDAVNF